MLFIHVVSCCLLINIIETQKLMSNPEIKQKILTVLEKAHPKDFTIQEVANEANFHRNTVSTYLKVLVAEKKAVITRNIGKVNLYAFLKKNNKK